MNRIPRASYRLFQRYTPDRRPVEVDLSDNTNLWGCHPDALTVVRSAGVEALARYPSVYADPLRDAVSRKFGVPPEAVATGCGSDDILDSTFRAAAEPGDRVAFPSPTFAMVPDLARMNGLEPLAMGDALTLPDPGELVGSGAAIVYLCRPNNPTGSVSTIEWVDRVLDARGPDGPLVVVDEAYADFADDSVVGRAVERPGLLVSRTLSKAYGLAGLRVGFGIGSPELVEEIEKSRGPYKVSAVAEGAAAAALDDASGWVAGIVERVRENRERLVRELGARGAGPLESHSNFVLVRTAPGAAVRITRSLRTEGIAVRPFPETPGLGDAIRVSIGPWELMERFLEGWDRIHGAGSGEEGR